MKFNITYKEQIGSIEMISPDSRLFSVELPDQPAQFIILTKNFRNESGWTSLPHGNEKLAIEVGKLIEAYFLSINKEL